MARLSQLIRGDQQRARTGMGQQLSAQMGVMPFLSQGYDQARQEISNVGGASRRRALSREQEQLGGLNSRFAGMGFQSPGLQAGLSRGVYGDTQRALSGIDQRLAGLYSNLAVGKGQAQAGAQQNLSNLLGQQAGQNLDIDALWTNYQMARKGAKQKRKAALWGGIGQMYGSTADVAIGALSKGQVKTNLGGAFQGMGQSLAGGSGTEYDYRGP